MLVSFSLRNHGAFHHRHTLNLATLHDPSAETAAQISVPVQSIRRMSKAALMFGGTGSIQSNFFNGLMTLRQLVMYSSMLTDCQFAALHTPSKLGAAALQPTEYEVDLLLGATRYLYKVAYDSVRVHEESLVVFPRRRAQRWFRRFYDSATDHYQWCAFSRHFLGDRSAWQSATRPQALFLEVATRLNSSQLYPLVQWFERCLDLSFDSETPDAGAIVSMIEDVAYKNQIVTVLRGAGLSISDIRAATGRHRTERQPMRTPQQSSGNTRIDAAVSLVEFEYTQLAMPPRWVSPPLERVSTYWQFILAIRILRALRHEGLSLLDRFDTNLTPLLASYFLHLLLASQNPINGSTLSHIIRLPLPSDLDVRRRDEMWRKGTKTRQPHAPSPIAVASDAVARSCTPDRIARRYIFSAPHAVSSIYWA